MKMHMWAAVAAAALAAGCATTPEAGGETFTPTYGSVSLSSGFTPDPYQATLTSGGAMRASNLGGGCNGWIAEHMDYGIYYEAGSFDLTISARSNSDTTLVVMGPGEILYCDDDSGDGLNPMITIKNPRSGAYGVWLGSYSEGVFATSTLSISELGFQ
ncbi:MAG: peptidase S1 [Maricaulaceae bacterium]|jgi:hypothetical protein